MQLVQIGTKLTDGDQSINVLNMRHLLILYVGLHLFAKPADSRGMSAKRGAPFETVHYIQLGLVYIGFFIFMAIAEILFF